MDKKRLIQELEYRTSRSSGPGGQHANKSETRVEAIFDLDTSQALDEVEKARIRKALANRLTQAGEIIVASQRSRSQAHNKEIATQQLLALLEKAAKPPRLRKRRPLVVDPGKRLEAKKRQALKKALRRKPIL